MEIKIDIKKTLVTALMVGTGLAVSMGTMKCNFPKKHPPLEQSIDYKTNNFSQDSDKVLLARMIFGEARWCSKQEKIAVAYSAINRANDGKKWNGETLREAILKPYQYSCFNKGTLDLIKLKDPMRHYPKPFKECLEVSKDILNKKYKDPSNGAIFYYNPRLVKKPSWAKRAKRIGRIGNSAHVFYK